jgi:uncharacterized membrane protein
MKTQKTHHKEQVHRVCQICGKENHGEDLLPSAMVRPALVKLIQQQHADWSSSGYICQNDLNHFRNDYVRALVEVERGELSKLDEEVLKSLEKQDIVSSHLNDEFESRLTFGQQLSDRISNFGGSWKFIIIFWCVLCAWMIINVIFLAAKPFDPYPFILLNLILSCLAAIQAPIIMMSQNRQETKDRLRAENDYKVNLKAELEIRQLHQKIDHLLRYQWERLVELQDMQFELIEEIRQIRPAIEKEEERERA